MSIKPVFEFVVTIGLVGLLYYIFNITLKDYLLAEDAVSSVVSSGPYGIFLLFWNGFLLIVLIIESMRLFLSGQRSVY